MKQIKNQKLKLKLKLKKLKNLKPKNQRTKIHKTDRPRLFKFIINFELTSNSYITTLLK